MTRKRWMACLLVLALLMILTQACAPKKDQKAKPAQTPKPAAESKPTEAPKPAKDDDGLWERIPIMDGATLDETTDCPTKRQECKQCEHRIYVTDSTAPEICAFYKEQMPKSGWTRLVFQTYPEGACMGTWMDGETRVFLTGGVRAGDKKVFVAITIGRDCPQARLDAELAACQRRSSGL